MRKNIKFVSIISLMFLILCCVYVKITGPNINDSIIVRIRNIEIDNMCDVDLQSCLLFGEYYLS